ncbi:MAG: hypothetical protein ACAH80_05260 [Alphaproteobacteria bacterium]
MADNSDNGGLYFVVGALVVAVGLIGFLYMNGSIGDRGGSGAPSIAIHKTEVLPDKAPVNLDIDIDKKN